MSRSDIITEKMQLVLDIIEANGRVIAGRNDFPAEVEGELTERVEWINNKTLSALARRGLVKLSTDPEFGQTVAELSDEEGTL